MPLMFWGCILGCKKDGGSHVVKTRDTTLMDWWFVAPNYGRIYPGGGFKHFLFSSLPWGRFPFWLIFFRWVETTNQISFFIGFYMQEVVFGCLLVPFSWCVVQAGRSARSKAVGGNSGFFLEKNVANVVILVDGAPFSYKGDVFFL